MTDWMYFLSPLMSSLPAPCLLLLSAQRNALVCKPEQLQVYQDTATSGENAYWYTRAGQGMILLIVYIYERRIYIAIIKLQT